MRIIQSLAGATVALALLVFNAQSAFANTAPAWTPCQHSAKLAASACIKDIDEELQITKANCFNITDKDTSRACFRAAYAARQPEREQCGEQRDARIEVCGLLNEYRYDPDPLEDPAIEFVDVGDIGDEEMPNPYFNLTEEHTYVLRAGEDFEEIVIVYVTDETAEVNGHDCRIVVDAVVVAEEDDGKVDYEAEEFTDDLYAQDTMGNVYYCGEVSRNFEDGILDNLDGSFRSGVEFAKAGVLIHAMPVIGTSHRQEYALGEAEDLVTYVADKASPDEEVMGFECNDGCLKTLEQSPLSPGDTENKYYLQGVGFVLAEAYEDGERVDEREELVCVGDSLEILKDAACGIENPEELLEDLCDLASQFCEEN